MPAASQVQYTIDSDNRDVEINTTVRLDCDISSSSCPVNSWRLPNWPLPEDVEVLNVRDSIGEIEDYSIEGNMLSLETNRGERRTSETVKINFRINREAEEVYRGLRKREFSLPGFSGERTFGEVQMDNVISGRTTYGFETSYGKDHFNFTGTGPVQIRLKAGKGNRTEYFEFFGDRPEGNHSLAYEIPVAMTGQVQNFKRFPVAVMDPETFNRSVGLWSAGEYIGGSIKIRRNLEEEFTPILAHEVVHGLNDRVLNWDQTRSSYIDEGTGKYVEYLVKIKLQGRDRVREVFGDDVTYTVQRDDGRYRITLPSQGDRERLWKYYRDDMDFMKAWSPVEYPDERRFGYAYSELIIKNFIVNSNGSMRDIYSIDPGKKVDSNEEKWSIYSEKIDLRPCDYSNRQRFEKCLDRINNYNYSVYRASEIDRGSNRIMIEDIDVPEREEVRNPFDFSPDNSTAEKISSNSFSTWLRNILQALRDLLSS
ncbi:hypothetical protein ACK3SF_02200 [Candidatus Nanosalina sp. VS9-1]|uniref:hypothetical protein n=1 Tax=Candidatus Nanosalina sp. VS9-1 TaxID=3388566 RepID=UPI0039E1E83B